VSTLDNPAITPKGENCDRCRNLEQSAYTYLGHKWKLEALLKERDNNIQGLLDERVRLELEIKRLRAK